MTEKEKLHAYCLEYVREKIERISADIKSTQASANAETKSSAGDKHETARAMAQLEVEMNSKQLAEAEKLNETLLKIQSGAVQHSVARGALVNTTAGTFYIAVSIGQAVIDGQSYFIISPESPVGSLLLGKSAGDAFDWKGTRHQIKSVN